ncbi:MAG: serine/threonine protein kinase [Elusimicrobia bacterium]|nr:serine/threonine protein kinase [Elusimicrobiota bacterium]
MTSGTIGLAMLNASLLVAAAAWAWPRVKPFLQRRRSSVVHAGRRVTGLSEGKRAQPQKEDAAQVLAGRWAMSRVIGRGGMGRVWEGVDRKTGRRIAVKTVEVADVETRKVLRDIYLAEARALSGLKHPNVVEFFEAVPDGDALALVFAYVSGKTIQQILVQQKRLDWEASRAIFVAVARALTAAHAGNVVHRDLKPANIMIGDDGMVKVMDFGVARSLDPDPHAPTVGPARKDDPRRIQEARTSTLVGTPAYIPPEALSGLITPRGDLFSAGVCLYETLTGDLPFGSDGWSPSTDPIRKMVARTVPGVPPAVDILLDDLLQPAPERRLADAATLEKRLLSI